MAEITALVVAGVACLSDLRHARIPNLLTFGAVAAALLFHLLAPQGSGASFVFAGLAAGLLVFFPFFALGAMGAGGGVRLDDAHASETISLVTLSTTTGLSK